MKKDDEITIDLKRLHKKGDYAITSKGYVFERKIFKILSYVIIIICISGFFMLGGLTPYRSVTCPEGVLGGVCENPFFGECEEPVCKQKYLFAGESLGEEKPQAATIILFINVCLIILAFIFNHTKQKSEEYNKARGKKWKE